MVGVGHGESLTNRVKNVIMIPVQMKGDDLTCEDPHNH